MKIFVGNIPYEATEEEIGDVFRAHGQVSSVAIPIDRASGRPRGFAFVEMEKKSEAIAAIAALNGSSLKDRTLVVNESRPRQEGGGSGGGGSYNRSGNRGGQGFGGRGNRPGGMSRRY
jgi:RNA recognition motif-containing protein